MLHAPVELTIRNNKLEISRLLVGPSPDSSPRASQAPPSSRSISVPTSTPAYPLLTSPTPSTVSQVSTATAPPNLYPHADRRSRRPSNLAAVSREPIVPPSGPHKRPPPDKPHSSASPAKKQSKWSKEEDAVLIKHRGVKTRWEAIASLLPGRSMTSCRLHYQNYLEKRWNWDEEQRNKLARLYERFKEDMWTIIGIELDIPWRACELEHWRQGEQDMARRAGVTPFSMSATGGPSPSSRDDRSGVNAATGASANSPGGVGGGARNPGGYSRPPSGELPPIHPGLVGSRGIGRRDDRGFGRRSEAGRGRGMTVLPGVAELEGGVGLYIGDDDDDDDDDDDEEEEKEEEEEGEGEEEAEAEIKMEDEEGRLRSRRA